MILHDIIEHRLNIKMNKNKILIVDDEAPILETLSAYFNKENFEVLLAQDGEEAIEIFLKEKPDVILLDWMIPKMSGPEVLKKIRATSKVPILMLTARDDESDIILGLELGADDYVTKPFGPREVVARIKSLLRRYNKNFNVNNIHYDSLKINFEKREILKNNIEIQLTPIEFSILKELYLHLGSVVTRQYLMENVIGFEDAIYDRTLDTHIKNLRKKLEDDSKKPNFILTIRGIGFKMRDLNNNYS